LSFSINHVKPWISWHVEEAAAALELRGIRSHRVGGPKSCFNPWIPQLSPQIAMKSPLWPPLLLFWVVEVNEDEWWLCRVSHGSYPFTADRNRCHRFSETSATGFHLTRGLLSINSFLHFHFLFLCLSILINHICTALELR
jgi:hypothetical protein